jgi:hypothetical protein
VISAGGSAIPATPFAIRIPSSLRCGSAVDFQLRLTTGAGQITLPIRLRVGRESSQSVILEDDVDSGRVKWKMKKGFTVATGVSTSGNSSYHAVDPGKEDTEDTQLSTMFMKKQASIPDDAGQVRLTFFHIFNFEPGFDGGVLEISTDGGATWQGDFGFGEPVGQSICVDLTRQTGSLLSGRHQSGRLRWAEDQAAISGGLRRRNRSEERVCRMVHR